MNLKISKDGEQKNYKLIKNWKDVNLDKWSELITMRTDTKSNEAIDTIKILSDIPQEIVKQLSLNDVSKILSKIAEMQSKSNTKLQNKITLDGIDYGFHPNLDDITLGEYADIETLIKDDLQKSLPDLMAILFRPITSEKNDVYSIEAYDGDIGIRREIMRQMSGEQVQNAMVFFWTFGKELLMIMESSLTEQTTKIIRKTLMTHLEKDGVGLE
tara:strand:- start:515 stop:1156 length:642 start_codon:yes stop_codon:yes gene_type:complete